jgi:hypothetical protein
MASRTRLFLSSFALAALLPVHAAELGDPRMSSHIGQPLVADIELTMLEDAATPVQVRVASAEVYNGAGIAVPPVLSSLNLSVMRRDGRQFLHVTSLRPVDVDHVHLYLELVDKGQRAVRLATLWLTPDPAPAPAVVAAPALARVAAPAPVPDAVLLAQVERARAARAAAAAAAEPVRAPAVQPRPVRTAVQRPRPAPVARPPVLPVAQPDAHPAACARPAAEAQACVALGAKNDELRARLGQVEDRMKKLQVSLGATVAVQPPSGPAHKDTPVKDGAAKAEEPKAGPAKEAAATPGAPKPEPAKAAAAHEQPKPVVPAGPRPIHSIKPLVPHKPKAPPPDEGLPWGWIGAAIGALALALGGTGAFVVVRRRRAGGVNGAQTVAASPGLLARLKARFAARNGAAQAREPTLY